MSYFRNVSKSAPCPICGKPDWCTVQFVEGGDQLHYCRRVTAAGEIVSPATGETYVFLKQTKEGSCMYKEKSAYLKNREEWLCKNGKKDYHKPNRQGGNPEPAATDPVKAGFHQAQPAQIEPLDNSSLDKIYRRFLSILPLQKKHIAYLRKEQWPENLILKSLIRSLPPASGNSSGSFSREAITKSLIKEFGSLKGVPGFYEGSAGKWIFAGSSGSHRSLYCDLKRDDFAVCYITEGEKKPFTQITPSAIPLSPFPA